MKAWLTLACQGGHALVCVRQSLVGGCVCYMCVCYMCVCVTCVCSLFFFFWAHEYHTNGRAGMCGVQHHLWRQKRNRSVRFMSHSRFEQQVSWQKTKHRNTTWQAANEEPNSSRRGGRGTRIGFQSLRQAEGFLCTNLIKHGNVWKIAGATGETSFVFAWKPITGFVKWEGECWIDILTVFCQRT